LEPEISKRSHTNSLEHDLLLELLLQIRSAQAKKGKHRRI